MCANSARLSLSIQGCNAVEDAESSNGEFLREFWELLVSLRANLWASLPGALQEVSVLSFRFSLTPFHDNFRGFISSS
jgi:hypothetical protein